MATCLFPSSQALRDCYLLNFRLSYVIEAHVNLESLARDLGLLAEWEAVVEG